MFRIGEFSKLTQVSIRMLRYYDETGILTSAEVDKWTGHWLYSVDQIPRLNKILYLRDSRRNVFEETELQRLWADVHTQNIASYKTLEKAGFKREGLIREGKMVNTYCDYCLYGMIKADYIEISQSKSALREKSGKHKQYG